MELNLHEKKDADVGEKPETVERAKWSNPLEFLLSCLSFAVGLGNIWRFPFLCYRNGGGAFLIPYVTSMLCLGIPLFFMELSLGQFASLSPGAIWSLAPLFRGLGISMLLISAGVATYYNIIVAWGVYYLSSTIVSVPGGGLEWATCDNQWNTDSCTQYSLSDKLMALENGSLTSAADEFFHKGMLEVSSGIDDVGSVRWPLVVCLLVAWLLVFLALLKGVQSFGKAVYFTAIFPYVILTILLVRGITMEGAMRGINFYLTPQWSKLLEVQVWADAAVQIFFSLGLCWGSLITLASYNRFERNCFFDAIVISVANCLTSFFAGFVVFSFVGFMSEKLNKPIDEVVSSGPGLAFIVYPEALSLLPLPQLWSFLFFVMLLALGLGTQFSCVENIVTIVSDMWPEQRLGARPSHTTLLTVVCFVLFLAGLTMTTQAGVYVLQVFDNHAATYATLVTGFVEILAVSWVYGARRFLADIQVMLQWNTETRFYRFFVLFWTFAWKVVTPLALFTILVSTTLGYEEFTYDGYHYPRWAKIVGWAITFVPMLCIPLTSIAYLLSSDSGHDSIAERFKNLLRPRPSWGPSAHENRLKAVESWHSMGFMNEEEVSQQGFHR